MRQKLCSVVLLLLAALPLLSPPSGLASERVTLESLLKEMTDRSALARFPEPAYACSQASSYDRDSTSPDDQKAWFANRDRSQFIRTEERQGRTELVMMDEQGPGAIVRIWATWHGPGGGEFSNGTLRVYLDGAEEPTYEGPIAEFISGGRLAGPPLSQGVAPATNYGRQGHNLYLPIPYAKHCKITYETDVLIDVGAVRGEALYYQINYRTYEEGTEVETFSMDALSAAQEVLKETQQALSRGGKTPAGAVESESWTGELAPGAKQTAIELDHLDYPGSIRLLDLKLNAKNLPQALRSTIVEIEFDGQRTVWVPAGDFFGVGYKIRPYDTWYTKVTADREMTCRWVMPFAKGAKVTLHNLGDQTVKVEKCQVGWEGWNWDDRSMHFHATWKQLSDTQTRSNKLAVGAEAFDANYVSIEGKGVYVGDTLTIFNGASRWWGEGDEKIYVDGEEFPSHFGTGTEDYYGYAWCRPEYFCAPFHAQPEGGGNLAGGFAVNSRYRALDAIPFEKSLKFDMEVWHWVKTTIDYAPATFFYARPGASSNVAPAPEEATRPVKLRLPPRKKIKVKGALEGEKLKVASKTAGETSIQNIPEFGWSDDRQLWWTGADRGDELVVLFPAPQRGKYNIVAGLTKANDYAQVEVQINGEAVGKTLDRYHSTVASDAIDLGEFELDRKGNRLAFKIVGSNPRADARYMVGLDYLRLEPVE